MLVEEVLVRLDPGARGRAGEGVGCAARGAPAALGLLLEDTAEQTAVQRRPRDRIGVHHFFLKVPREVLEKRIDGRSFTADNPEQDERVRRWGKDRIRLIKERTRAGLDAAKAQGRTGGRPSAVNEDAPAVARARKARGESVSAIAKALGVSRATLYRHLGDDS